MDNAKRTGTAGGKKCQLNDIDNLVLEIIGKHSPIVKGLGVADSMGEAKELPTFGKIIIIQFL